MKWIILLGALFLLMQVTTAHAAKPNLLVNGSFEQGFTGWEMHDQRGIVPGRCGTSAANLQRSFARQVGYKLQAGKTYKLVLWYVGRLSVSVANGEDLKASEWTKFVHTFTAEQQQPTIWLMGYTNDPLVVDCMKLVKQ